MGLLTCLSQPENVLFVTQMTCVIVVIGAALLNLTLQWGNQNLWTWILTTSLSAIMPAPKFKTGFEDTKKQNENAIKDMTAQSQALLQNAELSGRNSR